MKRKIASNILGGKMICKIYIIMFAVMSLICFIIYNDEIYTIIIHIYLAAFLVISYIDRKK